MIQFQRMTKSNNSRDQARSEERVEQEVKHIPEANVKPPYFPELTGFIAKKAKGENIKHDLNDIQISSWIDSINGSGIQPQIDERKDDLRGILVNRRSHPIRINMCPVTRIIFFLIVDEVARVVFILYQPSPPKIINAFLISR